MQATQQYRFSLRGLLLFVTAISVLMGTYSLFEVIGVTLALAGIGSAMYLGGLEYNRTAISVVGLFLALIMSLLTGTFLFTWLTLGQGPMLFRSSWPPALQEMSASSNAPLHIKARRDTRTTDFPDEYRWRMSIAPQKHAALVQQHGWESIPVNELPGFWEGFPAFWRPRHQRDSVYYRSPNAAASRFGEPGEFYITMYDPQAELLYVRYICSDR